MQFYKFHYVKVIDKAMKYYAVSVGRKVGIYNTWKECQQQVKSFSGAKYKKFSTLHDAQKFIDTVKQEGQGNKKQMTDVFKYTNNITKKELNIRKRKSFESIASYSKTMKIGGKSFSRSSLVIMLHLSDFGIRCLHCFLQFLRCCLLFMHI